MTSQWMRSYVALTRAFIRSQINNRTRLIFAAVGIIVAVNGIYQAPQLLSNLSQRTVKVSIISGTAPSLAEQLRETPHVSVRTVRDAEEASEDLVTGRADVTVAALPENRPGVRLDSAGMFGELASKTVTSVALREQVGGTQYEVVEERAKAHGQFLGLLLPSVLTFTLLSVAFGLALSLLGSLRSSGMLQRLQASGVTASPLLAAVLSTNFLMVGAAMVLLVMSAVLRTGTTPSFFALAATGMIGFTLLSSVGLLLASRFKNAQNASAASGLVVGLLTVMATPVPNIADDTAQLAVTLTPSGALTESFRAALNGADAQSLSFVLPVAAGWALLLLVLATRFFRWENDRG